MWRKQKSKLDSRLKQLEAEAEQVRNSIKALSKSVDTKKNVPSPADSSPPQSSSSPRSGVGHAQPTLQITSNETQSLLQSQPGPTPGFSLKSGGSDSPAGGSILRDDMRRGDPKFASYLHATGFSSERPLRQERSVQRNKAIFMAIFVLVVLYVVLKSIYH